MLILKGMIIGLGKIIPGVSGSMLAISMGVYYKIIDCIVDFFSNIKSNVIYLFKVFVGILLSIVLFSNVILKCLNNYYIITMFFFLGLIIGGLDDTKNKIQHINYKAMLFFGFIIFLLGLISFDNKINIDNSLFNFIYFLLVGFIESFTMIFPGISGTATHMMIGSYNKLMEIFSNLLSVDYFIDNFSIILPLGIGFVIGFVITIKLVKYLFNNYCDIAYSSIIGFSIATIILMAIKCINSQYTFLELIIAFIVLLVSKFLLKKINHCLAND